MESAPGARSDSAHTIFAEQQAIYRRVVEADYMSHRALFRILHDLLKSRQKRFSFLDLASGDASCSVEALWGTQVSDYAAVDLSEPALQLATENSHRLPCRTLIVSADFQHFMNRPLQTWDVIFIGFSYHHLIGDAKLTFARKLRKAVSEGGEWIFFEPILRERQTRADYLERWKESLEQEWDVFSATEKSAIWNHVANFDFPESRQSFEEIALKAGFHDFEHLYTDPWQFYGAFRAMA